MINPRLLDAFVSVVRTGSTIAAARVLNTSQPSVSRAVSELERDIGLELFSRTRGRLKLTQEGSYFYTEVDRFFAGTSELVDKAREIRNFEKTALRIVSIPAAALEIVPAAISNLVSQIGDIRSSYQLRSHHKSVDLVETGRADIGICNEVSDDAAVNTRARFDLRCVLAVPPGHRLAGRDVVSPADLTDESFISLGPAFNAEHIEDADVRAFLERISRRSTNLSLPACRQVAKGLGVALIDPLTAQLGDGLGVEICRFEPVVHYPVTIIESRASPKSRLNDRFVEVLREPFQRSASFGTRALS